MAQPSMGEWLFSKYAPLALMTLPGLEGHSARLALFLFQAAEKRDTMFNILWALVFGFATINILGLVVKHFDPSRKRMSFGETLAVLVVVGAAGMLGWELLYMFHVLPIKLSSQ